MARVGKFLRSWTACSSAFRRRPVHQNRSEDIGGGHRVLNGQVDSDPADRRHGMRGIANAKEPRPGPSQKAVDRHRQEADIVPVAQLLQTAAQERLKAADLFTKSLQAPFPDTVASPLGMTKAACQ